MLKIIFEDASKILNQNNDCADKKFKFLPVSILGP